MHIRDRPVRGAGIPPLRLAGGAGGRGRGIARVRSPRGTWHWPDRESEPFLRKLPLPLTACFARRGRRAATTLCLALAGPVAAAAGPWSVQRIDANLYKVETPHVFVRTEDCDDKPVAGTPLLTKDGGSTFLDFPDPAVRCKVRDVLRPVVLYEDEGTVRVTMDQNRDWYQVTDGDFYLHTAGCFLRGFTEVAYLRMFRDGRGRIRFPDGRACNVIGAYRRITP
jgi:hypothetical protein